MQNQKPKLFKSKLRLIFGIGAICSILVIGVAIVIINWYQDAINNPVSLELKFIDVPVTQGQTLYDIAPTLYAQGALKSIDALRLYLNLYPQAVNLQVGNYHLPTNLNMTELLTQLAKGPEAISTKVFLQEGIRGDEMANEIEASFATIPTALFKKADYLAILANPDSYQFSPAVQAFLNTYKPVGKSLEGFLFPDTYLIGIDAGALDVIDLQIQTLIDKLAAAEISPDAATRLSSFYEVLNLASIVEREAQSEIDMRMIADIFLRRKAAGMALGADAPLLYYFKDWKHVLTDAEINDTANPYNLRLHLGLPPTPISNPGILAIKAVISPATNNFYYFITGRDGLMYYATSLAEHNRNIANYL